LGVFLLLWVGIVLVVRGVQGIGAFHLMFEAVALQGGVFGQVLQTPDLAILFRALPRLHLHALNDCASKRVYLRHGSAILCKWLPLLEYRQPGAMMESKICAEWLVGSREAGP
jgi:hypothetical protein